MFTYDKDYFTAWRKLEKLAAKSRLAQESPGTAKHNAEVLVKQVEKLGQRGFDQYAVKDLIREYAGKIDLDAAIDSHNDTVRFRHISPRHARTR